MLSSAMRAALLVCAICALCVSPTWAGVCNGTGIFEGRGIFRGDGIFTSTAGTFEGTGEFTGEEDSSFEGVAACDFDARVQSVDGASIVVRGDGTVRGSGTVEVTHFTLACLPRP